MKKGGQGPALRHVRHRCGSGGSAGRRPATHTPASTAARSLAGLVFAGLRASGSKIRPIRRSARSHGRQSGRGYGKRTWGGSDNNGTTCARRRPAKQTSFTKKKMNKKKKKENPNPEPEQKERNRATRPGLTCTSSRRTPRGSSHQGRRRSGVPKVCPHAATAATARADSLSFPSRHVRTALGRPAAARCRASSTNPALAALWVRRHVAGTSVHTLADFLVAIFWNARSPCCLTKRPKKKSIQDSSQVCFEHIYNLASSRPPGPPGARISSKADLMRSGSGTGRREVDDTKTCTK